MTLEQRIREKVAKEAIQYFSKFNCDRIEAYVAAALPREQRIAELEAERVKAIESEEKAFNAGRDLQWHLVGKGDEPEWYAWKANLFGKPFTQYKEYMETIKK